MSAGRVCVTMDLDWANDGVLEDTIALVEELNIPVCLFVTHDTPLLSRLRSHPLFTLGIHPNFLPQLNGQSSQNYRDTLRAMLDIVPEAQFLRCHALIDATPILVSAKETGMKADLNLFLPFSSGIAVRPFRHFSGITRLPYCYEDDAWCLEANAADPETHIAKGEGLMIFNFHPIHLFLNTETMERYGRAKAYYHDFDGLKAFVNPEDGPLGARTFLKRLCACATVEPLPEIPEKEAAL